MNDFSGLDYTFDGTMLDIESMLKEKELSIDYIPRTYLIDTENIGRKMLTELEKLRDIDKAIIFESEKSFKISFKEMLNIDVNKVSVIETHNSAKNAMDFMITTILGHLVTVNKHSIYIILSNDTGFDEVVNFWKYQGLYVRRHTEIGICDKSLETQMHTNKEVSVNELCKIYDNKGIYKDGIVGEWNSKILKKLISFRSNEDIEALVAIIGSESDFSACKDELMKHIKYDKIRKLNIICDHWNEFSHFDLKTE